MENTSRTISIIRGLSRLKKCFSCSALCTSLQRGCPDHSTISYRGFRQASSARCPTILSRLSENQCHTCTPKECWQLAPHHCAFQGMIFDSQQLTLHYHKRGHHLWQTDQDILSCLSDCLIPPSFFGGTKFTVFRAQVSLKQCNMC